MHTLLASCSHVFLYLPVLLPQRAGGPACSLYELGETQKPSCKQAIKWKEIVRNCIPDQEESLTLIRREKFGVCKRLCWVYLQLGNSPLPLHPIAAQGCLKTSGWYCGVREEKFHVSQFYLSGDKLDVSLTGPEPSWMFSAWEMECKVWRNGIVSCEHSERIIRPIHIQPGAINLTAWISETTTNKSCFCFTLYLQQRHGNVV